MNGSSELKDTLPSSADYKLDTPIEPFDLWIYGVMNVEKPCDGEAVVEVAARYASDREDLTVGVLSLALMVWVRVRFCDNYGLVSIKWVEGNPFSEDERVFRLCAYLYPPDKWWDFIDNHDDKFDEVGWVHFERRESGELVMTETTHNDKYPIQDSSVVPEFREEDAPNIEEYPELSRHDAPCDSLACPCYKEGQGAAFRAALNRIKQRPICEVIEWLTEEGKDK